MRRRNWWTLGLTMVCAGGVSAYFQGVGFGAARPPVVATEADHAEYEAWTADLLSLQKEIRQVANGPRTGMPTGITAPPACTFPRLLQRMAYRIGVELPDEPRLPERDWSRLLEQFESVNAEIRGAAAALANERQALIDTKLRLGDYRAMRGKRIAMPSTAHTAVITDFASDDATRVHKTLRFRFGEAPRLWFQEMEARALRWTHLLAFVEALLSAGNEVRVR